MYSTLLIVHSIFRWFVLIILLLSIYRVYLGYTKKRPFSKTDEALRHWTATIAQLQMTIGVILYIKSPVIHYFWNDFSEGTKNADALFFGLIHIGLMMTSVVLVTIGSALAKRKKADNDKYKVMLFWFGITLLIILIAIPWPFSPLANRPYYRTF